MISLFPFHKLDRVKDLGIGWYFEDRNEEPVAFGDVHVKLFNHGLKKLSTIRLFDGLMILHGIFV